MKKLLTAIAAVILSMASVSAAPVADSEIASGWNHFTWGAEVGGSIDMTSNNLSTINLDAFLGYKNAWIDVVGIGASVNMMVSNSVRSFPVYGLIRTGFSPRPTLMFMDLRAGVAFNNVSYGDEQSALYVSPGIGVNLARGKTFKSYVMLSYVYNGLESFKEKGDIHNLNKGLHMGCVRIGISF